MKIAVMGAGGIGGYVGGRLAEAGEEVYLIARGSHLAAIQADGLKIESPLGDVTLPHIHATPDPAEVGPVDLILFAVKLSDADQAARSLAPMVAGHTKMVTLQNGIESKDIVGRHIDPEHVAVGVIYIGARIEQPGVVRHTGGVHRMVVDRKGGDTVMREFFAACEKAIGIEVLPTDDVENTLWSKFIALTAFAGATSISRLPIGAIFQHPATLAFMRELLNEVIAVARAAGQDFDEAHADSTIELFRSFPYGQKSSMLIDLEDGKPLELPWLSGKVHALGIEFGIPTPASSAVVAALEAYVGGPPKLEQNFNSG